VSAIQSALGYVGAVPIIGTRCQYCSRFFHPREVIRFGLDGQIVQCFQCREKHNIAVEAFNPPAECGVCRRSFAQLCRDEPTDDVKFYPEWIDGIYLLLCERCNDRYVRQRADLYGDTAYGRALGLK
jgi:hypothetical protein